MKPDTSERPRVTHVAIRFQGTIYSLPEPNRHHHVIAHIVNMTGAMTVDAYGDDQGFIDEGGRYLTRKQAKMSAIMNNQIREGRGQFPELYSEDLW